jgi:hypothetical protein
MPSTLGEVTSTNALSPTSTSLLEALYPRTGYTEEHIVIVLSNKQLAEVAREVAELAIVRREGAAS